MEHRDHPSPHVNDAKMEHFWSFAPSSLLWSIIAFTLSKIEGPDDWNCGRCAKWFIFRLGPQGLGQILVASEYKIYCVALTLCHG